MNNAPVRTVSILGCGWLGWPLARVLKKQGYTVKGSTTSAEKLAAMEADGIQSFLIDGQPDVMSSDGVSDFLNTDALFVDIPFRRNLPNPFYYQQQIISITDLAEVLKVPWIIFTGSTSVYPDNIGVASEDVSFEPQNDRSAVLLEIEQFLLKRITAQATVLRLAGLFGPGRELGSFAGKALERDPDSPVNLVHLEDCVDIISRLMKKPVYREIFNICCDEHPTRRELYSALSAARGSEDPAMLQDAFPDPAPVKIVSNDKIKKALNYTFKYPHPLDAYR